MRPEGKPRAMIVELASRPEPTLLLARTVYQRQRPAQAARGNGQGHEGHQKRPRASCRFL
jgi:hypothetical protein